MLSQNLVMWKKLAYASIFFLQIFNAEVLFREDATADQFIDVIEGNRKYMSCLYVYNKIDQVCIHSSPLGLYFFWEAENLMLTRLCSLHEYLSLGSSKRELVHITKKDYIKNRLSSARHHFHICLSSCLKWAIFTDFFGRSGPSCEATSQRRY